MISADRRACATRAIQDAPSKLALLVCENVPRLLLALG